MIDRPHIAIFGRCNAGKSSLLNLITGADTAIVSDKEGTTTDVVRKIYEIAGFAPVVFMDTAGVDDGSELGRSRLARTMETVCQIDLAVILFRSWGGHEQALAERFDADAVPYLRVYNSVGGARYDGDMADVVEVDAVSGGEAGRDRVLEAVKRALPEKSYARLSMFGGRVRSGDTVLLVCPIDEGAPAGRLILPQVQAIRELLDSSAVAVAVQPGQIETVLARGLEPSLVVADSQVLKEVEAAIPAGIEITTFSILLAAAKGDYDEYLKGLEAVDRLKDGDRVLIAENCSHQTGCSDIGRVKIPRWLGEYTGRSLRFSFLSSIAPLPDDLKDYALVVQCGGCMATRTQLRNRIRQAVRACVPITNYGMLIRKVRRG